MRTRRTAARTAAGFGRVVRRANPTELYRIRAPISDFSSVVPACTSGRPCARADAPAAGPSAD